MAASASNIPNHYELLGVARSASPEVVAAAYKALIRACHPDQATDDADRADRQARSAALGEAAATLKDPQARARYDARLDALAAGRDPDAPVAEPMNPEDAWAAAEQESEGFTEVLDAEVFEEEPAARPHPHRGPVPSARPRTTSDPARPVNPRSEQFTPDPNARSFDDRLDEVKDRRTADGKHRFSAHERLIVAAYGLVLGLAAWRVRVAGLFDGILAGELNLFDKQPVGTSPALLTGVAFAAAGMLVASLLFAPLRNRLPVTSLADRFGMSALPAATLAGAAALVAVGDALLILAAAAVAVLVVLVVLVVIFRMFFTT